MLKRLGGPSADPAASTNALGDWYATIVHAGRKQLIECTSANSLISVVFEAKQAKTKIREQLCASLESLLIRIGVPESRIRAELNEMTECRFAPAVDPVILRSMDTAAWLTNCMFLDEPGITLGGVGMYLSILPRDGTYKNGLPVDKARRFLENWHRESSRTMQ